MSKISAFLLILALAISAFAPANIGASSGGNAPANSSEPVCGETTTVDLLRNSNKKLVSGTVAVANGETTLFVTYTTASPWTLVQTDLAVAASLADIPVTNKGNPKVDQFPYRSSHAGITTYTYEIPLGDLGVGAGDSLVVAAHADLRKTGSTKTEGAWSDGTEFVPGKRSWGMYFTYSVQVCNEPPTAGDDAYSVNEDNTLNVAAPGVLANDTDPDGDPITAALVSGPTNGTLTLNADGSFSYTPNADFHGSDSFTYKANDGSTDSNVATVTITVNPINDAPVATDDMYSVDENSVLNVPAPGVLVNDTDVDGDPLSAILVTGPAHGMLTFNVDGSFTYTPDSFFHGSDSFTYKVNDGTTDSNVATANISVDDVNFAPMANDDAYGVDEDNMLNVAAPGVLANDMDPDSDPITAVLVSGPANGMLTLNADGSFSYTPDINYNGSDSFTYKANDGALDSNVATVTITINPVNDAPVANNDGPYIIDEDTSMSPITSVLANDADVDGDSLSAILVTGPAHGMLTLNPDGSFTYTPDVDYNGSDSFTYKANDGALDSNVATVSITVNPVNDPPVANDDSYNTIEDTVLNVPAPGVLSNDADVDGDSLSAILVSGPAHGTLTLNPDGSFAYTPDVDYNGSDSFTYKANDGQADSNVATVTITITPPNAAPVAAGQSVSTNEDTILTITLSATDADGDSLTFTIVDNPTNGSLGSLGTVTCAGSPSACTVDVDYTPALNYNGPDSFTFKANDGTQDSNTATVDITVDAINDAPSFTSGGNVTVDEDSGAYSAAWATGISAGPSDESGQTLSFNITGNNNPSLFSVAPAIAPDGTLSFTLAANANGTASLSVTLQDDGGTANGGVDTSTPVNFDIIVNGVNDGPVNTVPGAQAVDEDTDLVFSTANTNALSVADADAGSGNIQVTVSALNGTITPALGSGATIGGSGTSSATITGTLTQVNAALDGLKYKGNANFNSTRGSETLTLLTDDQGNTGSGGSLTDTDTVDITVNAVNDAPTALAKNFNAQANMKITGQTGLLVGATDPDTGDSGYTATFTVGTVSATTPAGGTISNLNNATGSFDFDPPPGASGNVTFTYTVCDSGNPAPSVCSAPATVTFNVAGPVIWFINPAAGVNGDGRLSTPFNSLASAAAVDASGHRIFVYTGTAPTASITLNTDEWLIGQGVTGTTFDALFSIAPPDGTIARPSINGTRPVIQGNVAMATSDVVRGLNIQPASGTAGLTASGATSLTVNEVSVSTANATAVGLTNSDGTFSFTRIDASGGPNGIVWNNASLATGSFTVIGDGTNTSIGGNGSGGTIANMSGSDGAIAGSGVYLNNARNVTLRRMTINGTNQNYGIKGLLVNGFILEYSTVGGTNGTSPSLPAPENYGEGAIYFGNATTNGVVGTATFTNNNISGGRGRNLSIVNTAAGTTTLTVKGNTFGAIQNFTTGGTSFAVEARVSSGVIINSTIGGTNPGEPNTFTSAVGDLVNFTGQQNTTMSVVMRNNTLSNNNPSNIIGGGSLNLSTAGTMTFDVTGNTMRDADGSAVTLFKAGALSGTPSMSGVFSNNTIGVSGAAGSGSQTGNGIFVSAGGTGTMSYTITNNTILQYLGNAAIYADNTGGSYAANFTITGNTAAEPGAGVFAGLALTAGAPSSSNDIDVCANITGNNFSAGDPANANDVTLGVSTGLSSIRLPGYGGTTLTNVESFVLGNNNVAGTVVTAYADPPATAANFIGGAACSTP